jgi:hypothetical protein
LRQSPRKRVYANRGHCYRLLRQVLRESVCEQGALLSVIEAGVPKKGLPGDIAVLCRMRVVRILSAGGRGQELLE